MTELTERLRLVPPEEEKATLEAIEAEAKGVMRELFVGQHAVLATCPEGLRDLFLLRVTADRQCFSVHPASLAKAMKVMDEAQGAEE
jgi:hypothetical protein